MSNKEYPLHPGQTHMEPQFMQIPLEEYETLKKTIETMAAELEELRKHELAWDLDKAKIKELEARQRWRRTSDEKPGVGATVIISDGFLFEFSSICYDDTWNIGDEARFDNLEKWPYWMPRPLTPKGM